MWTWLRIVTEPPIDSIKLYTQSWPLILSLVWSVQLAATLQLTLHPQCPDPRRLGSFSGLGGLCRYSSALALLSGIAILEPLNSISRWYVIR